MTLTYSQEQKEQVWRALGIRRTTEDEKRTLRVYGHGADWRTEAGHPVHERSLPKPEDVLWQLRELAMQKDAEGFASELYGVIPGSEDDLPWWWMKRMACATPQQIFEAALKTLEDK